MKDFQSTSRFGKKLITLTLELYEGNRVNFLKERTLRTNIANSPCKPHQSPQI